MNYNKYLREKMVPAFGCTEPIALAFAASRARFILGEDPDKIKASLSGNIIKNVNSVKVPGTDGRKGIEISLAAGAFLGDHTKKLEVLSDVDKSKLEYLDDLIDKGLCDIELLHEKKGLYIDVAMEKGDKKSRVIIKDFHTNIIYESLNDEVLFEKKEEEIKEEDKIDLSFDKIYDFAKNGNYDEIIDVLDKEIEYNYAIAKEGTEKENYKTSKQDKEGYTLTKIESTNGGQFNEDGSLKEAAYIADKKQEVTYIYQKEEQETPWTPLEPSTPVDPSEPSEPEEPKHTTPLVPLTPAEEVEVERITHHDHKTPGTPVVTEVPSTPVVETEKSVEEKTEKSEETKEVENKEEKAEKVEEIKEEAKTVEDDNLEKPQAPENYDKLAPRAPEKDKAPKTGDAGILSSLGLGSLAASGLAFIELKKRNKKNK